MTKKVFEEPIEERIIRFLLSKPDHTAPFPEINQNVAPDYSQPGLWLVIKSMRHCGLVETTREKTGQARPLYVRLINRGTRRMKGGNR